MNTHIEFILKAKSYTSKKMDYRSHNPAHEDFDHRMYGCARNFPYDLVSFHGENSTQTRVDEESKNKIKKVLDQTDDGSFFVFQFADDLRLFIFRHYDKHVLKGDFEVPIYKYSILKVTPNGSQWFGKQKSTRRGTSFETLTNWSTVWANVLSASMGADPIAIFEIGADQNRAKLKAERRDNQPSPQHKNYDRYEFISQKTKDAFKSLKKEEINHILSVLTDVVSDSARKTIEENVDNPMAVFENDKLFEAVTIVKKSKEHAACLNRALDEMIRHMKYSYCAKRYCQQYRGAYNSFMVPSKTLIEELS